MKFSKNAYFENIDDATYDFIERSKWHEYEILDLFDLKDKNTGFINSSAEHSTENGNTDTTPLKPDPSFSETALHDLYAARTSTKMYAPEGLTFADLSKLLTRSYYITKRSGNRVRFNIPSAGAMYPTEIYLVNLNIDGLPTGVYHYNPYEKNLALVSSQSKKDIEKLTERLFLTNMREDIDFENAAGILVFGSILSRVSIKYGDRGLRYAMIDTGAILQNFYLNATDLDIGFCANGGFIDDLLSHLLGFKDRSQVVLITAIIGKNKTV